MKKLFFVLVALVILVGTPFLVEAGTVRDNAGCGLGSELLGDRDPIIFQLFALTTNGMASNTIAMTVGTSGCAKASFVMNEQLNRFVSENMDVLAQDIAAGQGEALQTLAELMEIPKDKRTGFYAAVQANFSRIYTSGNVQSAEVIDNIVLIINQS